MGTLTIIAEAIYTATVTYLNLVLTRESMENQTELLSKAACMFSKHANTWSIVSTETHDIQ